MVLPVPSAVVAFGTGGFTGTQHDTNELLAGSALRISHGVDKRHLSEPKAEGRPAPALPKTRLVFSMRRAARWIPTAGTAHSHNVITQHDLLSCKQISERSVRVFAAELHFI